MTTLDRCNSNGCFLCFVGSHRPFRTCKNLFLQKLTRHFLFIEINKQGVLVLSTPHEKSSLEPMSKRQPFISCLFCTTPFHLRLSVSMPYPNLPTFLFIYIDNTNRLIPLLSLLRSKNGPAGPKKFVEGKVKKIKRDGI
jgi:hypothetical protein